MYVILLQDHNGKRAGETISLALHSGRELVQKGIARFADPSAAPPVKVAAPVASPIAADPEPLKKLQARLDKEFADIWQELKDQAIATGEIREQHAKDLAALRQEFAAAIATASSSALATVAAEADKKKK